MKTIRNYVLGAGTLMLIYFFFSLSLFVLSAGAYIFDGSPFSEEGHAMFLNIFRLPFLVILPCAGVMIYSLVYFFKRCK